jgi:hypothetical protein
MGLRERLAAVFGRRPKAPESPEEKARALFPEEMNDFWYCGEFNNHQKKLMEQGKPWHSGDLDLPCDTFLINPFSNYDEIREGAVLPCIQIERWVGYYQIIRKWRPTSWGDYLPWDDGYHVNLKLDHCERAPEKPVREVKLSTCDIMTNGAGKHMWYCVGVTPGEYCNASWAFKKCPFRVYKRTYNKLQIEKSGTSASK